MVQIDNTLISLDIFDKHFCCDLSKCFGQCCVDGDSGAPLNDDELLEIENVYQKVKKYLPEKNIDILEKNQYDLDFEGDFVTPLVDAKDCAYVFYEDKIAKCAIEKAFLNGETNYKKPISCHLYPIRITKYADYDAINYHQWQICQPACQNGNQLQLPLYKFLKEPLIRKYGQDWYERLEGAAEALKNYEPVQ